MRCFLCGFVMLVAPAAASAQTDARAIVEHSATAMGGLDRLRAVAAVRTVEEGLEYLTSVGDPRVAPSAFAETITALRRMAPVGLRQTTVIQSAMNTNG